MMVDYNNHLMDLYQLATYIYLLESYDYEYKTSFKQIYTFYPDSYYKIMTIYLHNSFYLFFKVKIICPMLFKIRTQKYDFI